MLILLVGALPGKSRCSARGRRRESTRSCGIEADACQVFGHGRLRIDARILQPDGIKLNRDGNIPSTRSHPSAGFQSTRQEPSTFLNFASVDDSSPPAAFCDSAVAAISGVRMRKLSSGENADVCGPAGLLGVGQRLGELRQTQLRLAARAIAGRDAGQSLRLRARPNRNEPRPVSHEEVGIAIHPSPAARRLPYSPGSARWSRR